MAGGTNVEEFLPAGVEELRWRNRAVLVATPHMRMYGHQVLEILYALSYARQRRLPLILRRPRHPINPAAFDVGSVEVRVVRGWLPWALATLVIGVRRWRETGRSNRLQLRADTRAAALETASALRERHPGSVSIRGVQRKIKSRDRTRKEEQRVARESQPTKPYWRRRLVAEPVAVHMAPDALKQAIMAAERHGIGPGSQIVTVHSRERGYKLGVELQDTKGGRDDSVRNARIETYFAAIDYLVGRGYSVVRIGDASMTPVRRQGVIDLATAYRPDPYLELYCISRSRLLLCGESGPFAAAHLMNTPLLTVNGTDAVSGFPIRETGILLLKHVIDRETGLALTVRELFSEEYLANLRIPSRYEYRENTPEEIRDAVEEMLLLLSERTPETVEQAEYRRLALVASESMTHLNYVRKWGADDGFIGLGRVARSQATPLSAMADERHGQASLTSRGGPGR